MKLKAAILRYQNTPLEVINLSTMPLEPGQVLVRVKASGICGAQLGEISGAKGDDKYLPHLMGHEGGGIVIDAGPGVKTVKSGDHVVLHWRKGEGIDAPPPKYKSENNEEIGGGWVTTFNTHSVVSENRLTKIDDDIPFDVAALMGCAVTTGLGLIINEAKLKPGQTIAIAGVGGVGLNVVQGARLVGAGNIIAIDNKASKRKTAVEFGANWSQETSRVSPVDVYVDCTGNSAVINEGLESLKPGGKLILVGQTRINQPVTFNRFEGFYCGKTIIDSQGGLTNPTKDIPNYIRLYRKGLLNLKGLISHRFKLDEVNKAIELMKEGKTIRCILEM